MGDHGFAPFRGVVHDERDVDLTLMVVAQRTTGMIVQ
jgi:hypothetical protein